MIAFDVVEDILIRLTSKDLTRFKSVCKSWYSLISSPRFVKSHLKHAFNNDDNEPGRRRIVIMNVSDEHILKKWKVVGSSNGLVCVSPCLTDGRIYVTNPSTTEIRKLPMAPFLPKNIAIDVCLSFGYDSSTDDYKVVLGIFKITKETLFQVFSLKSNTWKLIGQYNYVFYYKRPGVLFNGALHWFVKDYNINKKKNEVILSFNLSSEEFKVIPQPDHPRYVLQYCTALGIFEDCLCILCDEDHYDHKVWVLRNYNVKQSWELLQHFWQLRFDAPAHHMYKVKDCTLRSKRTSSCDDSINFYCDDNTCFSTTHEYIRAPLFVQSLVSPYNNNERPRHINNNKKNNKMS